MTTWVVPGAPLERGGGWRIWYSQPGHGAFQPATVAVFREGLPDGAVVPTAIGLNPSKTIAALAERLAALIVEEKR